MARIKIQLPEHFKFETTIPVRITDLNYGNHLANDRLLAILHEARVQFLSQFGYSEIDCAGVGLIMADVGIEYKNEAFYGNILQIAIVATDFSRVSFDLCYRVETNTQLIAKAKTGMVAFNYQQRKVTEVPEILKKQLGFDTLL